MDGRHNPSIRPTGAKGIDLLQIWMDLLLGLPVDLTPAHENNASIRFLTAERAGQLLPQLVVYLEAAGAATITSEPISTPGRLPRPPSTMIA